MVVIVYWQSLNSYHIYIYIYIYYNEIIWKNFDTLRLSFYNQLQLQITQVEDNTIVVFQSRTLRDICT